MYKRQPEGGSIQLSLFEEASPRGENFVRTHLKVCLLYTSIGEVSAIAFVAGFDVYAQPKDEPAKLLSELPELLQSMGLSLWRDRCV